MTPNRPQGGRPLRGSDEHRKKKKRIEHKLIVVVVPEVESRDEMFGIGRVPIRRGSASGPVNLPAEGEDFQSSGRAGATQPRGSGTLETPRIELLGARRPGPLSSLRVGPGWPAAPGFLLSSVSCWMATAAQPCLVIRSRT